MVATRRPVLALLPVLVLALGACGGTDDDTSAPTSSSAPASSVPASTAPAATTSGQATYRATEKPSASTNDASTAAISDQAYTDAQLAALLKGATINGQSVEVASSEYQTKAKQGAYGNQLAASLEQVTYSPAACKQATLAAAHLLPDSGGVSLAGTDDYLVLLRTFGSSDQAEQLVAANRAAAVACASYTAEINGSTMKGTAKVIEVSAASSGAEVGQVATATTDSKTSSTVTALGTVGNVGIQITDMGGTATAEQLSTALESVARTISANR